MLYQRNEVRTTIRPTNSDFRENGSRFAVRNACFAVTFKTVWFKDKSLGEGIKDLVIDLQKVPSLSCA